MTHYRVGFENPAVRSDFSERLKSVDPALEFVVDLRYFGFGEVVCACPSKAVAERIVRALTLHDGVEQIMKGA